jgi:hypothetical protein
MDSQPVKPPQQMVISASRRTDIPAFYMPWFMDCINRGAFEVENPYNRKVTRVPATAPPVHTIVFWSKDYGPFIEAGWGRQLTAMGYHLFFQFTLNSEDRFLEPNAPGLAQRLEQLRTLCGQFGPRAVNWRFDPVCFYRTTAHGVRDNLGDAARIAEAAAAAGIDRCTTSFMDRYAKIERRTRQHPGAGFLYPEPETKLAVLLALERELGARGIRLFTCCEAGLLERLPAGSGVAAGRCIPNEDLMALFGGDLPRRRDRGQRVGSGCGCRESVDIGSYRLQPCGHGCRYCYANPLANAGVSRAAAAGNGGR